MKWNENGVVYFSWYQTMFPVAIWQQEQQGVNSVCQDQQEISDIP